MTVRNAASMGCYGATWEARGYCGAGSVGSLINSLQGRSAIIAGGAEGVFGEVADAMAILKDPVIFATNEVGMFLPHVDHWVSLHADKLGPWQAVRWQRESGRELTQLHSATSRPFIDHTWEGLTPLMCLSGYFAMQIAWIMGASPIVLCGCPGRQRRRFFDLEIRTDFGYGGSQVGGDAGVRAQLEQEMERLPEFKASIRSMWGQTRAYFGPLKGER